MRMIWRRQRGLVTGVIIGEYGREDGKGFKSSGKIYMRRPRELNVVLGLEFTLLFDMRTTFLRSLVRCPCCELEPA